MGIGQVLQYDLTETKLFDAGPDARLPSDAELFAITVALLLVHEAAYSDLYGGEVALTGASFDPVVECIEQRMPEFVRDFGTPAALRRRLAELVGLRIACIVPTACDVNPRPT